jgi:hypothetical protein
MNYKSMILVALLLPVFCHSQSNEKHVTDLEEKHVTDLEKRLAALEEKHVTDLEEKHVTDLEEKHVTDLEEKHVTDLEKRLAALEAYVLGIVSLVNKNKEAINAAMETTKNSTCKLVGGVTLASLCGFIVLCKLYCRPLLP